ncbi:hypothetical protein GCM10027563_18400 [Parasphingorhabdus pacifica]
MPDVHPLDFSGAAHRVHDRIEAVPDYSVDAANPCLYEHFDELVGDCGHDSASGGSGWGASAPPDLRGRTEVRNSKHPHSSDFANSPENRHRSGESGNANAPSDDHVTV